MSSPSPFHLVARGAPLELPDLARVRSALMLFADPTQGVQIQGLPSGRSGRCAGGDLDGLVRLVERFADECWPKAGIYFAINPCPAALDRPVKSADILCRRWLLIDVDRNGETTDNASEAEKQATLGVLNTVLDWLTEQGWPSPIVVDSGNGWHAYWRIDLPNDKHAQALLKTFLAAIGERFDTADGAVDRAVHDAKRIAKLPGTWARKGAPTDDRPHRLATIIHAPTAPEVVTADMIRSAASAAAKPAEAEQTTPGSNGVFHQRAGGNDSGRAYARKALENECRRIVTAVRGPQGGANNATNKAAYCMGGYVSAGFILENEVVAALYEAAKRAGLDDHEIMPTIRSGLEAGKLKPRAVPERNGTHPKPPPPPDGKLTVSAASIQPLKVDWLWPHRVPKRFITVFAGRTGLGKSFVTLDVVSRLTVGGEVPFGSGECFQTGSALIVSEDPPEYMLVPRLIEMGADLDRVRFMSWEAMASYTISDVDYLDRACQEVPGCRVVVIDPPTNFLGDTDEHKNSEVRAMLMQLVVWVKNRDLACVLIMHVNKQTGKGIEAVNRVLGSVAWVSTARIAHSFAPDPEDSRRCLFVPMKNNLGSLPLGLAYRITATDTLARVEWVDEVDTTADEAMNESKSKEVDAAKWLVGFFGDKLELPSADIFAAAKKFMVSDYALRQAKRTLGIRAIQRRGSDGQSRWLWLAPQPGQASEETDPDGETAL